MLLPSDIEVIPLKVLIIDPDPRTASALVSVLQNHEMVISVTHVSSLDQAGEVLKEDENKPKEAHINVIYVDPISLGLERAGRFIFKIRRLLPAIVFVLYQNYNERDRLTEEFYAGERRRLRHYFTLDKLTPKQELCERVSETISQCQSDLYFSLTQGKIHDLQAELRFLRGTSSVTGDVRMPRQILKEIQDQLSARQQETIASALLEKSADFLGPKASKVEITRCFVVMPYSQSWSQAVERIIRDACAATGFEFTIARLMEDRFVLHDIWRGITGSGIIIADLTGGNANVAYEIGLADAVAKKVVLICQDQELPFDFHGHRLITYENSVTGALKLQEDLKARLKSAKDELFAEAKNQRDG